MRLTNGYTYFLSLYLLYYGGLNAQRHLSESTQHNKEFFSVVNNTLTYFCYDSTQAIDSSVALVVYCHGAEERIQKSRKGYVMERVIQLGNAFAKEGFVFAAGNFTIDPISNTIAINEIEELRKWCLRKFGMYPKMNLIGYSLGGYAIMLYSKKYPQHVSLITTVAGTLINHIWLKYPHSLNSIKEIPIIIYHGDKDVNVEYRHSVNFTNFFNKKGFNIKLNTYKNANHSTIHDRAIDDLLKDHKTHRNNTIKAHK